MAVAVGKEHGAAVGAESPFHSITVVLVGARNLRKADWLPGLGLSSDPYCVCRVAGKPGAGFRSSVAHRTQNPIWNVRGIPENYAPGDDLEFEVYDKDTFKRDDLLGRATLTSDMFVNGGFDGQLPLRDAGKKVDALLRVRVDVPLVPTTPEASRASTVIEPAASQHMHIIECYVDHVNESYMHGCCFSNFLSLPRILRMTAA